MAKIGHSELFWTTSVRKYWKSRKTAKIGQKFGSLQYENIGYKTAKIGPDSELFWTLW